MFKKYKLIVAMLIVGLVSTGFTQTVGASANSGDAGAAQKSEVITIKAENCDTPQDLERFLAKYLSKWANANGKQAIKTPNKDKDAEKPAEKAPEKPEQPAEQPTEQPTEQPAEQPDKVEQEPTDVEQPANPTPNEQVTDENNQSSEQGQLSAFEQQVFELTNEERAKYGLQPLKVDLELSKVAREKSRDMQVNNYFDHNSPTYGSPFDMMKSYGITYRSAGENIAKGQRTPQEVVTAWMNSQGHRENILNSSFTHIGVGYVEQGNYWTQQFIGK